MPLLHLSIGLLLGAAFAGALVHRQRGASRGPGLPGDLDRAALGILLIQDRKITWANARCGEILGVDPANLAGASTRAFHQDEAAFRNFGDTVLAVCERGEPYRGDVHLRRADGSPFWAYLAGGLRVPGQPEAGVLWFMEEVTDRVEAQLDLAEVLSLNQKLIAASPTAIMLFRAADGACVLANEAAARLVGGRQEDLLRQNFRRLKSWQDSGLREAADRALSTGLEQHLDCHFFSTFGNEIWTAAHFVPFVSRGERLLLLLADDVSERVRAATALRESEERHRVVVEALNEGLCMVDSSGRLTYANARLGEMGGYAPGDLLGRHYAEFVAEEDRPRLADLQLLGRPVRAEAFEVGILRRNGSVMEAHASAASVMDEAGDLRSLVILLTDISVRRKAERERERLVGELEQKNKELETLLYVASHDLRSPLVNIQGFSQRLARSLADLDRALDGAGTLEAFAASAAPHLRDRMPASLEFIRSSGARMDAIINGLLTLSRAGRMVLRAERLDMNAVAKACADSLAFQLQSAEGTLAADDLPPCTADPVQVAQILANLLDNAVKYRDRDRPLKVRLRGAVDGDFAEYRVEDNGVGIAPEHQQRIWEIFQRLEPQGPTPGEGLGLTLVRRMVERNGGTIRLESAPGEGCTFILRLPVG